MDTSYIREVAARVNHKYGEDYEWAINVAECIVRKEGDVDEDASRVYAVMMGEL